MKVLIGFIIGTFLIGALPIGRTVRERPLALVAIAVLVAGGYYSLRVVQ